MNVEISIHGGRSYHVTINSQPRADARSSYGSTAAADDTDDYALFIFQGVANAPAEGATVAAPPAVHPDQIIERPSQVFSEVS